MPATSLRLAIWQPSNNINNQHHYVHIYKHYDKSIHSLKCFSTSQNPDQTTSSSTSTASHTSSPLDTIPPSKLKELRKIGLEMKDVIKLGRRGVGSGLVTQIQNRWRTSDVAKLYCGSNHANNMKQVTMELEQQTGGIVIHRSGGSVYLYKNTSDDLQLDDSASEKVEEK